MPHQPAALHDDLPFDGPDESQVPRLPRVYVPRLRVWEQLEGATDRGITLLVAPVGAGKTLGVSGWLRRDPTARPVSWQQADSTWSVDRMQELLDRGTPAGTPDHRRTLVVIDDAHLLPAPALRLLDARLNGAPDSLRLLLLSRWDLPLTRLTPELMGHFTVLRGDLLRMEADECLPLIAEHARSEHPEIVRAVTVRSGGWCAAVVLASRAISASPDPVTAARRFVQGSANVADRLASEVFAAIRPRERHLLLCVANEEVVSTEDAVHLTHDPQAGETLAALEATGLLVSRTTDGRARATRAARSQTVAAARYRIHPLMVEVVRRRLVAGGVDVAQAQSTIRRAVRLDLARGETEHAFPRLVAANAVDEAARVLAEDGLTLLLRGHAPGLGTFARRHPEVVEGAPGTWFVLALDRWLDNDPGGAGHWLDRLLDRMTDAERDQAICPQAACVRLMRGRMGGEPLLAAVGHARQVVLAHVRDIAPLPLLPLLLAELGAAQSWLGDLTEAEVNLSNAVALSRARGLDPLTPTALSHLALTLYMQGRESASAEIAREALELAPSVTSRPEVVRSRAMLARDLSRMSDVPHPDGPAADQPQSLPIHVGDPVAQFWARVRDARLALMQGSVSTAEQTLELPPTWFRLPDHLRVSLLVERGFLASLGGDHRGLKDLELELDHLGARGEAALLRGLREELDGDRKAAVAAYAGASEASTFPQPASRALALCCEAQLLDVLGRREEALSRLRDAATLTEVRRNAVPFLGWSRQGTPMATLLARLERDHPTAWVRAIAAASGGRADIASIFAPLTATPRERGQASDPMVLPSLSAREREVLNELARGATYADIAADLFVSENTIKTHVSSLYGKLSVTRRSEALAVARNLHLL